ncbi:MAG: hypothetical protein M3Q71_02005 [Chloroflexota bacterium]|nr:hypothetical protein [Chloroflexota bacterium]MDP9469427.1 hypothetical protein [Chloroflexota bacterium]
MTLGLTHDELQEEIRQRMDALDQAQEDVENLGPYGDLLRLTAQIAFQRAADLITINNHRIARQLEAAGVSLLPDPTSD